MTGMQHVGGRPFAAHTTRLSVMHFGSTRSTARLTNPARSALDRRSCRRLVPLMFTHTVTLGVYSASAKHRRIVSSASHSRHADTRACSSGVNALGVPE